MNIDEMFSKVVIHSTPVKDHPLKKNDEHFKSAYYEFLYITAQYENNGTENQLQLIRRIMDGTNTATVLAEHIRNAEEITAEKTAEFINDCKTFGLAAIFFIDCILVSCSAGKLNKKQVEYLSEIAAALEIPKDDVQILCEYASAILEQSTEKYEKANKKDLSELYRQILCYTRKFITGALANTSNCLHFYSMNREAVSPKKILVISDSASYNSCELSRDKIIFENVTVDFSGMTKIHDFHIVFNCVKNVIFKSCDFINGGSFRFHGCSNILIEDCSFSNFDNDAVFDLNQDCTLSVNRSVFKNCGYETVFSGTTGGVIKSTALNRISFRDCTFSRCFALGTFKGGIVSFNNNIEAYNCKFSSCNKGTALFCGSSGSFRGDGNELTDCVELKG